jgi:hypothetical protein
VTRPRSLFAGGTDYTAVPLDDILAHLEDWRDALRQDIEVNRNVLSRLLERPPSPQVRGGQEFSEYFIDLFERFIGDFDRLVSEIPSGVRSRHVEITSQVYRGARDADRVCVAFKRDYRLDALSPSDRTQNILAELYRLNRDAVIDLFDLSNVVSRLRTYVDDTLSVASANIDSRAINALELKPNFFGVGVNLNWVIDWLYRRKQRWNSD